MTRSDTISHDAIPAHVPPDLVRDWDYTDAGDEPDIFVHWRKVFEWPEIFYTPRNGGHWVVTRAKDVAHVLEAYQSFSSVHTTLPKGSTPYPLAPAEYDPPAHQEFRKLIAPFFTPRSIAALEAMSRSLTISLIEGFRENGECEFASEFALHMPIGIFMSLADLPESDRAYLVELAERIVRPRSLEARLETFASLFDYLRDTFAKRRKNPGNDVMSALVTGKVQGGRHLTDEEMLGMGSLMIAAGLDTVASSMSFMAMFLANNPDHRRRLIEQPDVMPTAIEEMLRRFNIANQARMVVTDMTYKGVLLKGGDMVLAPGSTAGLDDERYPDAWEVDFDRADKRSLIFGKGPHQCIGAFLARTEIKVFLTEWLRRIPDFAIAPGKTPIARPGTSNTVEYLPLVWKV